MIDFREAIAGLLKKALPAKALPKEGIKSLIEIPPDKRLGDYALPCFKLSPVLKKEPTEIAKELINKITLPKEIKEAKIAGAYINFFVNADMLAEDAIGIILKEKNNYGKNKNGKGKKVMVEYSAPNTNKPLHIGHLRNDSIGMSISNILEVNGFSVIRANLYSDRGIHICKSMLAYKKWGKGKKPKGKPDKFVGDFYVIYANREKDNPKLKEELPEMLRKWEDNDKETRALWKKMNSWAIAGMKKTYKEFGSRFDVEFRESAFYDKAKAVIGLGLRKGIFKKDKDGAIYADLENRGLPKKIVVRADGTSIYITNDLALTKYKFEKYKLDRALWVVGSEQNLYFKQLFKIFKLLGFKWAGKCKHLSYGMVFLPEGRLKSREGRVIDADELIEMVENLAKKELKKRYKLGKKELENRAKKISLGAIKFYMLRIEPVKNIFFDTQKAVSFEGDTGPYLQYTYARARSILRKAGKSGKKYDASLLKAAVETELIKLLSQYPEIIVKSSESLQPSILCQYLLDLCSAFNLFYHTHPVLKAESDVRNARLKLVEATAITIKNGLGLLGIEAIERM